MYLPKEIQEENKETSKSDQGWTEVGVWVNKSM
jgi:hypothetical protein